MARHLISAALIGTLSGCSGVTFSHVDDMHSLEYRSAVPAVTVGLDADCKATSQVVTIPGMKTRAHLRDNLAGARLRLSTAQVEALDALAARLPPQGERHPPAMMQIIDREP